MHGQKCASADLRHASNQVSSVHQRRHAHRAYEGPAPGARSSGAASSCGAEIPPNGSPRRVPAGSTEARRPRLARTRRRSARPFWSCRSCSSSPCASSSLAAEKASASNSVGARLPCARHKLANILNTLPSEWRAQGLRPAHQPRAGRHSGVHAESDSCWAPAARLTRAGGEDGNATGATRNLGLSVVKGSSVIMVAPMNVRASRQPPLLTSRRATSRSTILLSSSVDAVRSCSSTGWCRAWPGPRMRAGVPPTCGG